MLRNERSVACIIAGGGGTRFWPLSTDSRPKQYLSLISDKSLLQDTYERLSSVFGRENVFVITTKPQAELAKEQLPDLKGDLLVVEPQLRDTCPAISYMTMLIQSLRGEDSVVGIFPADHHISDINGFKSTLGNAYAEAEKGGRIVTVGIKPTFAATQYGYIELNQESEGNLSGVKKFHEKPDKSNADKYFNSGGFLWNSGMFVWKASLFLDELKRHSMEHYSALNCMFAHFGHKDFGSIVEERYHQLPKISVDYAVMEKSGNISVIPAGFDWSDIGSWRSLYEFLEKDEHGNSIRGKTKLVNCSNSLVINETDEWLLLSDKSDTVVIKGIEGTLVSSFEGADDIKPVVREIKDR